MELVKQHTVKDALYMLADAWEERSTDSICKAYNELQIHPHVWTKVSEPELEHIILHDVEDRINVKNELPTSPQSSDEQILQSVVGQSSFEDESRDDEEDDG